MTTEYAVTMQELELEHAELLPARETLCSYQPCSYGNSYTFNSFSQSNGNNYQVGLVNLGNINVAL
jgi:hypothetical protein